MNKRYWIFFAGLALMSLPVIASAISLGTGRLTSVTPKYSACVSGPTGGTVQMWDVERGDTYIITISNVTECSGNMIDVRVNASMGGHTYFDLVAYYVSPGVYQFEFYLPANGVCTFPILYCTTPGDITSGYFSRRNDGGGFQAHLRASYFEPGCTNPEPIISPDCDGTVPVEESSWGAIKTLYD